MPELPEVETIVQDLKKQIKGQKIERVEIKDPKSVGYQAKDFVKKVTGRRITEIKRRAKLLIFTLDKSLFLLIHLKISGQLIVHQAKDELDKYTRVVFYLSSGKKLYFNDLRKFGYLKLFDKNGFQKELKRLNFGLEPLEKDFTLAAFTALLEKRRNKPIKPLLMEQSLIAGIGNIYASESCFLAGIKPTRLASSLKKEEKIKLFQSIKKILRQAIKYRGTSVDNYVDAEGREGKFESHLKVYGRQGEKCYRCGHLIKRITQNSRSTYYCPYCQK